MIISTKLSPMLRSQGNNNQRDYFRRGVKNTDKLETMSVCYDQGQRRDRSVRNVAYNSPVQLRVQSGCVLCFQSPSLSGKNVQVN